MTMQSSGVAPRELGDDSELRSADLMHLSNTRGVQATGRFAIPGDYFSEFTVLAGAVTAKIQGKSMNAHGDRSSLYNSLLEEGTIASVEGRPTFQRDYEFSNAGIATEILCRRSCNEGLEWQSKTGTSLRDLRRNQRHPAMPTSAEDQGSSRLNRKKAPIRESTNVATSTEAADLGSTNLMRLSNSKGVKATGRFLVPEDYFSRFIVLAGAVTARVQGTSMSERGASLYGTLVVNGTIVIRHGEATFQRDFEFDNAAGATEVLVRRACTEGREWRNQADTSLMDLRKQQRQRSREAAREKPSSSATELASKIADEIASSGGDRDSSEKLFLLSNSSGVEATGYFEDPEDHFSKFIVLAGATTAIRQGGSMDASGNRSSIFIQLVDDGVIADIAGRPTFQRDYKFDGADTASIILYRRHANAGRSWRSETGTWLKDLRKQQRQRSREAVREKPSSFTTELASDIADEIARDSEPNGAREATQQLLYLSNRMGVTAIGYFTDSARHAGSFTVMSGATTAIRQGGSMNARGNRTGQFDKLVRDGVIAVIAGRPTFQRDYQFSSITLATEILCRRSCEARREWRTATGTLLKDVRQPERDRAPQRVEHEHPQAQEEDDLTRSQLESPDAQHTDTEISQPRPSPTLPSHDSRQSETQNSPITQPAEPDDGSREVEPDKRSAVAEATPSARPRTSPQYPSSYGSGA